MQDVRSDNRIYGQRWKKLNQSTTTVKSVIPTVQIPTLRITRKEQHAQVHP